ncbi:hypothetical protein JRI60_28715 [Archangium violaceum]|uniref:hypothetical protein n=1 Tax=Archangium violaceum TaxID=83451 RepID=UPI00194F68FB|nr:hypothetical protein [Archangium violaceum]QRN93185.1 hypothetical protein JRI60_28715 [Archangium violaceum]
MLLVLNPFIESHAEGSKEREAFKLAQAAMLYIRDNKKEDDFARYYKRFSDTSFTVEVSHEFATRAEADQWLASGNAKDSERVKIAGKGFMAVEVTGKLRLMVAPLPEELETDEEWKEDPESP